RADVGNNHRPRIVGRPADEKSRVVPRGRCHPVSETGVETFVRQLLHRVRGGAGYPLPNLEMRRTWDALAGAESSVYVGDPATGASELAGLFGRLEAGPRGGLCVEVGCGPGRMTGALAERFDRVLALDVSPAMLERARGVVTAPNVTFLPVPGDRLEGVEDAS